jgi:hypothetical protein
MAPQPDFRKHLKSLYTSSGSRVLPCGCVHSAVVARDVLDGVDMADFSRNIQQDAHQALGLILEATLGTLPTNEEVPLSVARKRSSIAHQVQCLTCGLESGMESTHKLRTPSLYALPDDIPDSDEPLRWPT